ncbi:MAG: 4-hydroxy-tetrahydrodipicolinate synthase [Gammaproteobacteria bacterium]|nr:4-hydroxy-tetrahydrodipicolinate synthase [Gammaproteobacteria bacterium]
MFTGSCVALVTPMLDDDHIDYQAVERLLEWHLAAGTDAIVALGSTGEGAAVLDAERDLYLRFVVDFIDGRLPVIAGAATNITKSTIELAHRTCDLGVSGLLMATPYYNRPTQEGLYQHFSRVAEQVTLPIILYNVPGRTGCDMLPETVIRLAKIAPIIGLKEAVPQISRVSEIRAACGEQFLLYSGDDPTCLDFMLAGGNGVISISANIAPEQMHAMCEAVLKGNHDLACHIQQQLTPVHHAMGIESNPIPVKWAVARKGYIENVLRLPLTPLSTAAQVNVEQVLKQAGLL